MKLLLLSLALAFTGIAMAAPEHQLTEWSIGRALYGSDVSLDDLNGQAVVISYWSAGSREGAKSIPLLSVTQSKFRGKGLVVIAAEMLLLKKKSLDAVLGGKDPGFTITRGARGPVEISNLPHSFVFDPKGNLLYSGQPSDPEFEAALGQALVSSKPSSTQRKRAAAPAVKVDLIPERKWMNHKGEDVTAAVIAIKGDKITFRMTDGREIPYLIKQLSAADQKFIRETARK